MKFNPEKVVYYEEFREKAEQAAREYNEQILRTVLESPEFCIGEGTSADVYFIPDAPNLCIKVISRNKTSKNHEAGLIQILPHTSVEECRLTALAASTSTHVRVPKPLFIFEVESPETNDILDIICMQKMDAVTVDEVLSEAKPLPEAFNLESFSEKLELFLNDIHEARLYHQDLHGGNVMIDNKTGEPCVIDFGASYEGWAEEDTLNRDESSKKTLIKKLHQYLVDNNSI